MQGLLSALVYGLGSGCLLQRREVVEKPVDLAERGGVEPRLAAGLVGDFLEDLMVYLRSCFISD